MRRNIRPRIAPYRRVAPGSGLLTALALLLAASLWAEVIFHL
ncbi:MAG TPA: hypothetical protein VJY39_04415 [Acidisphaera sp.]|nr:hypothetical protein [Acidisphaera sp.]